MGLFMKKVLIGLIGFYRAAVSPHKPPCCRFYPTCSAYAAQALEIHGALRGALLAAYRILRCNPLCRPGYDPVPLKKTEVKKA